MQGIVGFGDEPVERLIEREADMQHAMHQPVQVAERAVQRGSDLFGVLGCEAI